MLDGRLARFVLLPELKLLSHHQRDQVAVYEAEKIRAKHEICPKCATPSSSVYDRRKVKVRDEPLRRAQVLLIIRKRRYYCHHCRKPFTEPIAGIMPKRRTTQRLRRAVVWACDHFTDLKKVRSYYRLSSHFIYKALYEQLDLKVKERQYPWPKVIGIDEHFFSRRKGYAEFATVITDMKNKRLKEVVKGKSHRELWEGLEHVPGRENVERVALDLSDSYRSFVRGFFPNAELVADKFHVLRLLTPYLMKRLKEIEGRRHPMRGLLLRNSKRLSWEERSDLNRFLVPHQELRELYYFKERLSGFYRIRGYERAKQALTVMREQMKASRLPEIQRLRRTLTRWEAEILAYFKTRLTNARTEGFNNVAKLVQKRAYGYKRFENYRRRLLSACF